MKNLTHVILTTFLILFGTIFTVASIVDQTFQPFVTKTNSTSVLAIAVQPDRKYLVGGQFNTASGMASSSLARFNSDGTIDTSFQPQFIGSVTCLVAQDDGKILVA